MDQKLDQLKFVVLDEEDLEIVSTHLQDAVVKVSDVLWRPQENRLVVALNRFDWEGAQASQAGIPPPPRRLALRAGLVLPMPGREPGRQRRGPQPAGGRIFRNR